MIKQLFVSVMSLTILMLLSAGSASAQTFNLGMSAQPGPDRGTVQLYWNDNDTIGNYNIAYGPSSNHHLYGAVGIGNISNYIVRGLTPGQRYYFSLSPVVGDTGLAYIGEVSAIASAKGGASATPSVNATQATIVALPSGNTGTPWYLSAVTGNNAGEVNLSWTNTQQSSVDNFDLVYGSNTGVNEHGYQGVRQSGTNYTFTVGQLTSGKRYFFSILPQKGDSVEGNFSQPVSAVAR